jgi:hypothetical protein
MKVGKIKLKKGNIPDSKFNRRQLHIGTLVEMEHTNDKSIAKQIAKAHLTESGKYYFYLNKMEHCMKQKRLG